MKTSFRPLHSLVAVALLCCVGPAPAAVLILESFNYSAGSANGVATNATGLTGNWTAGAQGGTSNATANFDATSVTMAGHFAASGGSLIITNSGPGFGEGGAAAAVTSTITGTSLYSSSLMSFGSSNGSYFNDWSVEQRFNTSASGGYTTSSGRNEVRAFGSGSSSTGKGAVSADASEVAQSTGTSAANTNYLLVTRYILSGSDITSAQLFAFDATSYASYLANATTGNADSILGTYANYSLTDTATRSLNDFDFLQFTTNGGPIGRYDDFRMGTSILDVVNVGSVPEPSRAMLGLVGMVGVMMRRRRRCETQSI
ncbi:MAG: hypothetical protein IPK32_21740 [Verrucomicrobiaceae bacterium]|nr:hypothetical protein [Verrucomicrobiaceae bacterium]